MVSKKLAELQSSLASAERVFTILEQAPDVAEDGAAIPIAQAAGAVSFQRVSFAYPNGHAVLQDMSLDIAPGTRVGIMGTTGAGKSTLLSLLLRFYDPDSGRILLDGRDIREYRLGDLRNQFAVVLQDPVLFSASIAENIAYARPGASAADIVEAARAANAHHFIQSLPDGYDTQVGERGVRLSGGERQRISIARAFLKGASILVLDEPTASVDVRTEAMIIEAMERLSKDCTTFIIAHRTSTLAHCTVVMRMEEGRVAPDGQLAAGRPARGEDGA
jgi:ATP-binding cassette subfamily B protein